MSEPLETKDHQDQAEHEEQEDQAEEQQEQKDKQPTDNPIGPEFVPVTLPEGILPTTWINIQVCGKHFGTELGTLCKYGNNVVVEKVLQAKHGRRPQTTIQLDRDPQLFAYILKFLRGQTEFLYRLPEHVLLELYEETRDYYQLDLLFNVLDDYLYPQVPDQVRAPIMYIVQGAADALKKWLTDKAIMPEPIVDTFFEPVALGALISRISDNYPLAKLAFPNQVSNNKVDWNQREPIIHSTDLLTDIASFLLNRLKTVAEAYPIETQALFNKMEQQPANHQANESDQPQSNEQNQSHEREDQHDQMTQHTQSETSDLEEFLLECEKKDAEFWNGKQG